MGLFEGIEKLINEHGSAAILRERIQLINDQYTLIERKLIDAESEIGKLQSENRRLHHALDAATDEIKNLKKLSDEFHFQPLEEIKEKILLLLTNGNLSSQEVSESIGTSEALAEFHLHNLAETNHITHHIGFISTDEDEPIRPWHLAQPGRKYLARRDLLK